MEIDAVYTFKLTTGEEIIGTVKSENDEFVDVFHPSMLLPDQAGHFRILPWLMTIESELVYIPRSNIIAYGRTRSTLANEYMTGTKQNLIKTPPKPTLVVP